MLRTSPLITVFIFEEETEELNLVEVANYFSCGCDRRKDDFGERKFVKHLSIHFEQLLQFYHV